MIKQLIVITVLLFSISSANAFSSNRTTYEFSYQNTNIELIGSYFGREVLIKLRKDMFQVSNESIVNTFRNVFTAYHNKKMNWLLDNSTGRPEYFKEHAKKYLNKYKNHLTHIVGYALYENYVILLLKQKEIGKKHIFVLEQEKDYTYKISLDFEKLHPIQYKAIEQAYMGNGSFKIFKKKNY